MQGGRLIDGGPLVRSLLGFNLGIEAMQLLVIAAILQPLILLSATRWYTPVRIAGAAFAVVRSLGWIAERAFQAANPLEPLVRWLTAPPTWLIASVRLASGVSITPNLPVSVVRGESPFQCGHRNL